VADPTGAPLGDAILAGVATGVFQNFNIAKEKARYVEPLEPDDHVHQLYMEYFELYKSVYSHLRDDFASLQGILRGNKNET
jgi:xylulokinase